MSKSLRTTWAALVLALVAVVASGCFIVRGFERRVLLPCSGELVVERHAPHLAGGDPVTAGDLEVRYEATRVASPLPTEYTNVRVVWTPPGAERACSDLPLPWSDGEPKDSASPASITLHRVGARYVARGADHEVVFRTVHRSGRRFVPPRAGDPGNVPLLVFLVALGALAAATVSTLRAAPYARAIHRWQPATLRADGVVEDETGAVLGRLDPSSSTLGRRRRRRGELFEPGDVLVAPAALADRDVYRAVPILTRDDVAIGSHARWRDGTLLRLRDAWSLAIVSSVTTGLALIAHLLGS